MTEVSLVAARKEISGGKKRIDSNRQTTLINGKIPSPLEGYVVLCTRTVLARIR